MINKDQLLRFSIYTVEQYIVMTEPKSWEDVDYILDVLAVTSNGENLYYNTNNGKFASSVCDIYQALCLPNNDEDHRDAISQLVESANITLRESIKIFRESGGSFDDLITIIEENKYGE